MGKWTFEVGMAWTTLKIMSPLQPIPVCFFLKIQLLS